MEDQICSPEKYWITNFYDKKIFNLEKKKMYDKKICTEYKYILIE